MVVVPDRPTDPWKEPQSIWLRPSHAALKKLLVGSWWNHLWFLNRILYWALSATSQLLSHKLSVWPACCTVLTGGLHGGLSLNPVFRGMWFASFDSSWYLSNAHCHWRWRFCLEPTRPVLLLCFSLWAEHGRQSSGFSRRISFVTSWLAEAAWVIGSPEPSAASMLSASNENTERQDPAAWTARNTVHNKAGKWLHTQTPGVPPLLPGRSNRGMQKYFIQKNNHKKANTVSVS